MRKTAQRTHADRLIYLATAHQAMQAIAVSVRIGLFEKLGHRACDGATLASMLAINHATLGRFMNALCCVGLVQCRNDCYALTPFARRYLHPDSPSYLGALFVHQASLVNVWSNLKAVLTKGTMQKPSHQRSASYSQQLMLYLQAHDCLGKVKAERIMKRIDIRRYRMMLDLGGGLGTYAVACARAHKQLIAIVADLPDVVVHARRYIRNNQVSDRVKAVARHCLDDPLPKKPYDFILVSNVLHLYRDDDCMRLILKATRALVRGGTLVIHDYLFGCGDQAAVGLFDLMMLVGTPEGRCYHKQEVSAWMRAAGIGRIRTASVMAGTSMVWGIKV
ncbi:MAG: methyltransferase [Desulfobacterota bacterium]|nr:methyltransferase [Thermodesulfobacteriota bacterium]